MRLGQLFVLALLPSAAGLLMIGGCSRSKPSKSSGPVQQQPQSGFLMNKLSERCLDVLGAPGTENGNKVALYDCEYTGKSINKQPTDQKWSLTTDGFIKNTLSGRCLDVWGAPGGKNGDELGLFDCESSGKSPNGQPTDQKWFLTPDGFIKNQLSGRCVDVLGAPGTANGSAVVLWDCETELLEKTDQKWMFVTPQ
jgi:hypothetical protein